MASRSCDGCLGTGACWICNGDGCARCDQDGRCHLCEPQVVHLEPPTRERLAEAPQPD